jgi:hypothetical protein
MKTSTKATEVIEKDTEATLGNKKEAPKGAATLEDSPTMTEEDIMTAKKLQQDACGTEDNHVLAKYGVNFLYKDSDLESLFAKEEDVRVKISPYCDRTNKIIKSRYFTTSTNPLFFIVEVKVTQE